MSKRLFALLSLLASGTWTWGWEFIRSLAYEKGSEMLSPFIGNISLDQVIHWGPGAALAALGLWLFWKTKPPAQTAQFENSAITIVRPMLEMRFTPGAPYETTTVSNGRTLSTVRIGLKAQDGLSLSNCKLYVEKIAPQPPLPGGLPILLEDQNFSIRHDDPERFVEIASHWNHVDKFRFSSPGGHWAETMNYIDDDVSRVIELRIKAEPEYEKSVAFRIWTDELKRLHMERA